MSASELLSLSQYLAGHRQLMGLYDGPVTPAGRRDRFDVGQNVAWWIRDGSVEVKVGGRSTKAHAGDWVILPIGAREQAFSDGSRLWSAAFAWESAAGQPVLAAPRVVRMDSRRTRELNLRATRLAREVAAVAGNPSSYLPAKTARVEDWLRVEAAFLGWLESLHAALGRVGATEGADAAPDPRVWRAKRAIDATAASEAPDYTAVAKAAGLSREHLQRLFKATYHETLHGYFDRRRLAYALRRLMEPDGRVKVVAAELGFVRLPRFSVWFQRHEKIAPRRYRQQAGFSS